MREQILPLLVLAWVALTLGLLVRLADADMPTEQVAGIAVGGAAIGAGLLKKWKDAADSGNLTLNQIVEDVLTGKDRLEAFRSGEKKVNDAVKELVAVATETTVSEPPAPSEAGTTHLGLNDNNAGVEAKRTAARWRALGMGVGYAAEKAGVPPEVLAAWEERDEEYQAALKIARYRIGITNGVLKNG